MFEKDVEQESPNEGAGLRIWGTGIAKRGKIDVEPESPNERACLILMMK